MPPSAIARPSRDAGGRLGRAAHPRASLGADQPYWSATADRLLLSLSAAPSGLTSEDAAARLRQAGPNSLAEKSSASAAKLLLRQFASPLVLILAFGACVSLALGEWIDASIILAIVAGSALLGFYQEYRAEQVAEPQRWDVAEVRRFMIVFGLVSSCFDGLTFALLLRVLHADAALFQTVWFLVSLLTELVVVLVIRTRRPALLSRPSPLLLWSTIIVAGAAMLLPFSDGVGAVFGMVPLSPAMLAVSVTIVLGYAVATEIAKRFFHPARRRRGSTQHSLFKPRRQRSKVSGAG